MMLFEQHYKFDERASLRLRRTSSLFWKIEYTDGSLVDTGVAGTQGELLKLCSAVLNCSMFLGRRCAVMMEAHAPNMTNPTASCPRHVFIWSPLDSKDETAAMIDYTEAFVFAKLATGILSKSWANSPASFTAEELQRVKW